jgi:DNA-binding CsgD family transcriptional regulator/PAS domain-containing protein
MSAAILSELIELIYRGPLEAMPWAASLRQLNQQLDASWAVLVLRPAAPERPSLIIESHYQQVAISTADYTTFARYSSDPFTGLPAEQITSPEEFLGAERWFDSDFFRDYLQPRDIHYQIGADFYSDRHSECRLRVCRPRAAGAFSAADRQLCQWLVPHFKQAVYLQACLTTTEAERRLYAGAFDRMHVGTVILDDAGTPLTVNQAAELLLAERDGLQLSKGVLRARPPAQDRVLQAALAAVLAAEAVQLRALSIPRAGGRSALKLLIKTIPRWQQVGNRRPAAAIYIRDPDRVFVPSADVLRMLFGFTPAESSLAKLLAEGLSLDQAVARLGISKNTGKSRLRAIFAKTGASRQSTLVRLLLDTIVSL